MNDEIDFSQFIVPSPSSKGEDELHEFAQFRVEPERSNYEKFVQRPGQIAGQSIVAGLKAIPRTGYDLLKAVVSGTGGDLSKLEEAEQNAPQWLKDFARNHLRPYEEIREEQKEKSKGYISGKPLAQPEGPIERGVEKFGRFLGESPAFGGVGGTKGLAALGGLAAGAQVGEEAQLGPLGQFVTGALGALAPGGIKAAAKAIFSPKQTAAKGIAHFSPKESLDLQKQIIQDAREAGIQLDLGSLTNNDFLKSLQTKLYQSSLAGKPLEDLKKNLSSQVVRQYKDLAESLGKSQFETVHEAGEVLQNALKAERDASQKQYRALYEGAKKRLTDSSVVYPERIISTIGKLESELKPGALKSTEQKAVLNFVEDIKKDVMTPDGHLKGAKVKDLLNDKIAIHDIVDYELEGGTKQLLKILAKEIDETVQQYARVDAQFAKEYKLADKKFAEHAGTFRNKNISSSLRTQQPEQVLSKMNTIQGIRDLKKALGRSTEGKKLFNDMSRFKLDQIFEKNLQGGAENQIKFGQFGHSLMKGKNKDLTKELLGPSAFTKLENLTKTSSHIADAANKFLNTSKTGASLTDMAVVAKILTDVAQFLSGNPWPFVKTGASVFSARQLSKLMANPEFLKSVEDVILVSSSTNPTLMKQAGERLMAAAQKTLRDVPEMSENAQQSHKK